MMKKVFEYHRHLMLMDARKDIILQNDFTNRKIKNKSVPFFSKYTNKIKQNKMRIYYLLGFSAFFSLGPVYDFICDSKIYDRVSDKLADLTEGTFWSANRDSLKDSQQSIDLAKYFLDLQRSKPLNQITAQALAVRTIAFKDYQSQTLTIDQFVDYCSKQDIKIADLPPVQKI